MIKCALFDLDGTLTDSSEGIFNSFCYALSHYGITRPDEMTLNRVVGPPLHYSFRTIFGFSDEKADEAVALYREYYGEKGIFESVLYPGVDAALAELKKAGMKTALATSKPAMFARRVLCHFDIDKYFDAYFTAALKGALDEKNSIIESAVRSFTEFSLVDFAMIGDRSYDMAGAKHNGITAIGVTYGFGNAEELTNSGADHLVDSASELPALLLGI